MTALFAMAMTIAPAAMLVALRVGVAMATLPAPLGAVAPVAVRAMLSLMIALALVLARGDVAIELDPVWLGAAAIGEAVVGIFIGGTVRGVLATAEMAGDLAATAMGLSFASQIDPTSGEQTPVPTMLFGGLAMCVFFSLGGDQAMFFALGRSLDIAPPGEVLASLSMDIAPGAHLFREALRIASPIVATMFVVQLGVALIARTTPRLHVFPLSFAAAASVGMLVMYGAATPMTEAIRDLIATIPTEIDAVLGGGSAPGALP